jgi:hypothetical protein
MNRWSVRFRNGEWRVYDGRAWHDRYPTLPEAHTEATKHAIACELFAPGGLARYAAWRDAVFGPSGEWEWCYERDDDG